MPNAWIEHIKQFSKDNNVSYGCALSMPECKDSYKKKLIQNMINRLDQLNLSILKILKKMKS
jgi:hypothetical protein